MSVHALSDVFGDRIVSKGIWPARSTDLKSFFFWDYLKDNVYNSNPRSEEGIQENIRRKIVIITAEQLQRVNQNLFCRREE
jgi:hypothetical protein